jgi:hypothetical protein
MMCPAPRRPLALTVGLIVVAAAFTSGCGRDNPQRQAGTIEVPAPAGAPGYQKPANAPATPTP